MTIIKIRTWPDVILSTPTKPVESFSTDLADLISSMTETMYSGRGVGLAAPQVGSSLRVFIMDTTEGRSKLEVFINPVITQHAEKTVLFKGEGCLSFPGLRIDVSRYSWIEGTAQNVNGEVFSFRREGVDAQCISHEIDHLDGIVMVDHLNRSMRRRFDSVYKRKDVK